LQKGGQVTWTGLVGPPLLTSQLQALEQSTPPLQLPSPLQSTVQGPVPQVICPLHAFWPHVIVQLVAFVQSTTPSQVSLLLQSTSQARFGGQTHAVDELSHWSVHLRPAHLLVQAAGQGPSS
jgi:hypothetical protein